MAREQVLVRRTGAEVILDVLAEDIVCSAQGLFRFVWVNEWQGSKC